jgi:hypothetical protein
MKGGISASTPVTAALDDSDRTDLPRADFCFALAEQA